MRIADRLVYMSLSGRLPVIALVRFLVINSFAHIRIVMMMFNDIDSDQYAVPIVTAFEDQKPAPCGPME